MRALACNQTSIQNNGAKIITYVYFSSQVRPEIFIPIVGAFAGGADVENSMVTMTFDKKDILQSYS